MNKLLVGIKKLITMEGAVKKDGRHVLDADLGVIENAAIVVKAGKILWVGTQKETRSKSFQSKWKIKQKTDLRADLVLPGFIDCHTHTVFAGNRQDEFEMRNTGVSYEEIARRGGGILKTVKATRSAKKAELLKLAEQRAQRFLEQGVTTVEMKSGYGLDLATEKKILQVIAAVRAVRTVSTFLGAHAVPPEFKNTKDYLDEVISWLPKLRPLTNRIDAFVENGYFSVEDSQRLFKTAQELGFEVTAHAEQLNATGAAVMAAHLAAKSVDHCVQTSDADGMRLAQTDVTCVLLPTSDFYIHIPYPPARQFIDAGVRVALATDFNPGTSPTQSLNFLGVLARLQMRMSLAEVLSSLTVNAAKALGLQDHLGSILPGKNADFVVMDGDASDLFYEIGHHPVRQVWRDGRCQIKKN